MKLALLVEGFDPARGGAERAVRALSEALLASGHALSVYAPAERAGPPLPAGGRVVGVELPRLPRPLWAWSLARRLSARARAEGAELVIATGKQLGADLYWPHNGVHAATLAAAGQGRFWARLGRRLRPAEWSYAGIEARALSACARGQTRLVALSERVAADLRRHHHQLADAVIHNGIDPTRFRPPTSEERGEARRALARRIGARGDRAIALFCAHAFRLKGLETLLRAAAALPEVHVAVAGGGSPHPWLPLAQGLNLMGRLSFMGHVKDMTPVLRGATFLAHPSRYDPCSLVVIEALASGLPVIGSAADGAAELIGAAGRVVPPGEVLLLEDALRELADPRERAKCAAAAAEFRRPWSQVGAELLQLGAR